MALDSDNPQSSNYERLVALQDRVPWKTDIGLIMFIGNQLGIMTRKS